MMVQNAPDGAAHFISTMAEHNDLCGQFARVFGNDEFEPIDPYEEMLYAVSHHDRGWETWDSNPGLDPKLNLPAGLGGTPPPSGIEANRLSPEFNERRHAYCGLLVSMHSWGLFNARYGFSEFRVRPGGSPSVPIHEEYRDITQDMLDGEIKRQERLKAVLAEDAVARDWIEESHLMQNYKQLQFFDTLALYFNLRHESERGEEVYVHVPKTAHEDATITLRPAGDGRYEMNPFPFKGDRLEVACQGKYVTPYADSEVPGDLAAALQAVSPAAQEITFVRA